MMYRRYWTMLSEVIEDPESGSRFFVGMDASHKPYLQPTVSSISHYVENMYPDMEIRSPVTEADMLLPDAVRALDLYGFLNLYLKDRNTGRRYNLRFMEIAKDIELAC